mgnify:FL=1
MKGVFDKGLSTSLFKKTKIRIYLFYSNTDFLKFPLFILFHKKNIVAFFYNICHTILKRKEGIFMNYKIEPAYEKLEEIKMLFQEYTSSLGFDLSFQNYEQEYRSLPGKYAPPKGRLYLLVCEGIAAGCVALKPLEENICEMKRLYIKKEYRKHHFGEELAKKVIEDAKAIGYEKMYLDTMSFMKSAIGLYQKLGFEAVEPYYENPMEGVLYFQLPLK